MNRTIAAAGLAAAAGLPAAQAQAPADTLEAGAIERIVVTTQKRAEAAFDVPITLTAYDQARLELFQVDAFDDLSSYVPGLNVQLQSPNNPGWVIRGITTDSGNFQDPPRVSVYLNGVDVSRSRGSAFELFDVERVEVAKGPQATLFGTAASVGAISVITAKPEEEFGGEVYASFGSFSSRKIGGYVTGGSEVIQARLAGQFRERDGFVTNIAGDPGSNAFTPQEDLNGVDTFAIRPSLRFTPSDTFTADLVYNYELNEPPGTAFKSGVITPSGGDTDPSTAAELGGAFGNLLFSFDGVDPVTLLPNLSLLDRTEVSDFLGDRSLGLKRTIHDVNASAEWVLNDSVTLTGVAGYREFDSTEVFDADGSQVPLVESAEDTEGEQTSFELRVNYDAGGKLRGFAGVNYFEEDGFQRVPFAIDETLFGLCLAPGQGGFVITPACVNPDGSFNRLNIDPATAAVAPVVPAAGTPGVWYPAEFTNTGSTEAISFFVDGTYAVTPKLELTAGVRFIDEERESGFRSTFPQSFLIYTGTTAALPPEQIGAILAANPGVDPLLLFSEPLLAGFANTNGEDIVETVEEDALLPRFNALYRVTDDLNLYATVGKGRRSPVFSITQDNANTGAELVEEEIVWNYEGGVKADFLDGALNVEAGVFYQEYEDFRVQLANPATGLITNQSAGEATNFGVELAGTYVPTPGLTLIGTYAYIDAEIEDDAANGDLAGNQFRLQPENSGSFTADYRQPVLGGFEGFATVNVSYRSEVFFEADNDPRFSEDDVSLVDLRLGLGELGGAWEVAAFGENVFDEDYIIDAGNTGRLFGSATFIAGPPAIWGVEVRGAF